MVGEITISVGEHVNAGEQVMLVVLTGASGNFGGRGGVLDERGEGVWMREQLVNYCPLNYCQTTSLLVETQDHCEVFHTTVVEDGWVCEPT